MHLPRAPAPALAEMNFIASRATVSSGVEPFTLSSHSHPEMSELGTQDPLF